MYKNKSIIKILKNLIDKRIINKDKRIFKDKNQEKIISKNRLNKIFRIYHICINLK